jgi:hypothetical protein
MMTKRTVKLISSHVMWMGYCRRIEDINEGDEVLSPNVPLDEHDKVNSIFFGGVVLFEASLYAEYQIGCCY